MAMEALVCDLSAAPGLRAFAWVKLLKLWGHLTLTAEGLKNSGSPALRQGPLCPAAPAIQRRPYRPSTSTRMSLQVFSALKVPGSEQLLPP
eukprot:459631-Amphidinium_carterae.1